MLPNNMKYNKSQLGFTLIELLVVISIIGVLSSIVLASVANGRKKAHEGEIKSNLIQIRTALELYYSANGSYPSTGGAWWTEGPANGSHPRTGPTGWIPNLAPSYIPILPHDKYTGQDRTSIHAWCDSNSTYYFYKSDGANYKVEAWCLAEYFPIPSTSYFADPWITSIGGYQINMTIYTPAARLW